MAELNIRKINIYKIPIDKERFITIEVPSATTKVTVLKDEHRPVKPNKLSIKILRYIENLNRRIGCKLRKQIRKISK